MKAATANTFRYWATKDDGTPVCVSAGQVVQLNPTGSRAKWLDRKLYDIYEVHHDGEFLGLAIGLHGFNVLEVQQ